MKLSTSTTRRPTPGPAPARHARVSASPSTRSSWRTCPNVNARRNVPRVEGAATRPPRAQQHEPLNQTLEPQPLRERRRQRDPGVRHDPLIVKNDPHLVQSDRPIIMHHQGDLLCRAPAVHTAWKSPAQEVILASAPDRPHPPPRWIQAQRPDVHEEATSV